VTRRADHDIEQGRTVDAWASLGPSGYAGLMARFVEPDAAPEQLVDGLDGAGL